MLFSYQFQAKVLREMWKSVIKQIYFREGVPVICLFCPSFCAQKLEQNISAFYHLTFMPDYPIRYQSLK